MKTLTVIKVTREEVAEHWGGVWIPRGELFIRCNQKGHINWDKAPLYTWEDIVKEKERRPVYFSSGPKEQWIL